MKVTSYRAVYDANPSNVERKVCDLIDHGYEIFGSPMAMTSGLLVQACIKKPEPEAKDETREEDKRKGRRRRAFFYRSNDDKDLPPGILDG